MSKLVEESTKAVPDPIVILYDLDLTKLGGGHFYFTPEVDDENAQVLTWREEDFLPLPCEAEGFEMSGTGQFPRPVIRVSNILKTLESSMNTYNDLIGATITRWRVFAKNLDDGSDPDPDVYFPPDVYTLDRKRLHNSVVVEWELASIIDQEGVKLPRRQVLRDTCTHIYRGYDADEDDFDYTKATCPYVDTDYFTSAGQSTTLKSQDACSKLLESGCRKRFPDQPLPFRGFPGVSRFR